MTPPQQTIKELFDYSDSSCQVTVSNLAIETGSYANFEADYDMPKERLYVLFKEFYLDTIVVVGYRGTKVEAFPPNAPPIGYVHHLYVRPVTVDQYKSDGSLRVCAEKLNDKWAQEIRLVLRTNMTGSMRLTNTEERKVERVGATELVYGDSIGVDYLQYVTNY